MTPGRAQLFELCEHVPRGRGGLHTGSWVQVQGGDMVKNGVCKSIQQERGEVGPASSYPALKFSCANSDEMVILSEYVGFQSVLQQCSFFSAFFF